MTSATLDQVFDKVFFTGGCFVGKLVAQACAKHLTPYSLELGGKSPCIVDETADIGLAARRIAWGSTLNSGQTCIRPDYLIVHHSVAEKLKAGMKKELRNFYSKDPQSSEFYSRIVNARAHRGVVELLDADTLGASAMGKISFGGARDEDDLYIEPTLVDFGADWSSFKAAKLMSQEIFGPILPMVVYGGKGKGEADLAKCVDFIVDGEKP